MVRLHARFALPLAAPLALAILAAPLQAQNRPAQVKAQPAPGPSTEKAYPGVTVRGGNTVVLDAGGKQFLTRRLAGVKATKEGAEILQGPLMGQQVYVVAGADARSPSAQLLRASDRLDITAELIRRAPEVQVAAAAPKEPKKRRPRPPRPQPGPAQGPDPAALLLRQWIEVQQARWVQQMRSRMVIITLEGEYYHCWSGCERLHPAPPTMNIVIQDKKGNAYAGQITIPIGPTQTVWTQGAALDSGRRPCPDPGCCHGQLLPPDPS